MPGSYIYYNTTPDQRALVAASTADKDRMVLAKAAAKVVQQRKEAFDAVDAKRQAPSPLSSPRKQVRFSGQARLRTLSKGFGQRDYINKINDKNGPDGSTTIWLPCLPETIELARGNHYDQNGSTMVTPDGIWIYQYTEPLEIQLSFHLHAFDDLCPDGPMTLLDIAARLQSMQLPASNDSTNDYIKPAPQNSSVKMSAEALEAQKTAVAVTTSRGSNLGFNKLAAEKDRSLKYPVACELRLMSAGSKTFGINCVGFIKQTKISLHGPYLNTLDESEGFNLPSAATYEFTFVHNPQYTNALGQFKLSQAYGPDVNDYLYNTAHLAKLTGNSYDGLDALTSARSIESLQEDDKAALQPLKNGRTS